MTAHRTMVCESCKIVFKAWTDLKSHACKAHGNSRNNRRKRKEMSENNMDHRIEDEDEAELKPDSRKKKKARKDISLTRANDMNAYDQDITNRTTDENNNNDFSHDSLQYNFKCKICGNLRINEAHLKKHTGEYHRAKVKAPEEADNIKHGQRTTNPHGITEKTEDMKPGKELGEYKSFAPLYSNCDNCERSWASTSNSQHHKNVKHVKLVVYICDTMPRNERQLRRHMSKDHNDHGKLKCKSCGNVFDEEKDLRIHVTS